MSQSHPHTEHHFKASDTVRDIIIVMTDGPDRAVRTSSLHQQRSSRQQYHRYCRCRRDFHRFDCDGPGGYLPEHMRHQHYTMPSASWKSRKYATYHIANARK